MIRIRYELVVVGKSYGGAERPLAAILIDYLALNMEIGDIWCVMLPAL